MSSNWPIEQAGHTQAHSSYQDTGKIQDVHFTRRPILVSINEQVYDSLYCCVK